MGCDVVGWAGGTERALAVARDADIDAALLDVNLDKTLLGRALELD